MKKIIGLIRAMAQLEELKGKAIESIEQEVDVLEEKLKNMRSYLKSDRELGLREVHDSGLGTTDEELETLMDLHDEIERLKEELSRL